MKTTNTLVHVILHCNTKLLLILISFLTLNWSLHSQCNCSPVQYPNIVPEVYHFNALQLGKHNNNVLFLGGTGASGPITWGAFQANDGFRYQFSNSYIAAQIEHRHWNDGLFFKFARLPQGPNNYNKKANFVDALSLKYIDRAKVGIGMSEPKADLHLLNDAKMRLGPWEFSQEGGGNTTSFFRINRWTGDGTSTWTEKLLALDWSGKLFAKEINVTVNSFPDYVFDPDYNLLSLEEIDEFIETHNRLPGMPPEEEVINNGLDLGKMELILIEKIEELTLHLIAQQKEIERMNKELMAIKTETK